MFKKITLLAVVVVFGVLSAALCFLTEGFCETMLDEIAQQDILNNLIRVDDKTGESLYPEVISQEVLNVKRDEKTQEWQEITEKWVLKSGEEEKECIIKVVPAVQGGINFTIIPMAIAEEMGIVE